MARTGEFSQVLFVEINDKPEAMEIIYYVAK